MKYTTALILGYAVARPTYSDDAVAVDYGSYYDYPTSYSYGSYYDYYSPSYSSYYDYYYSPSESYSYSGYYDYYYPYNDYADYSYEYSYDDYPYDDFKDYSYDDYPYDDFKDYSYDYSYDNGYGYYDKPYYAPKSPVERFFEEAGDLIEDAFEDFAESPEGEQFLNKTEAYFNEVQPLAEQLQYNLTNNEEQFQKDVQEIVEPLMPTLQKAWDDLDQASQRKQRVAQEVVEKFVDDVQDIPFEDDQEIEKYLESKINQAVEDAGCDLECAEKCKEIEEKPFGPFECLATKCGCGQDLYQIEEFKNLQSSKIENLAKCSFNMKTSQVECSN